MKKSYSVSFSFNSRDNKSNVCLLTVIAVKFMNNTACCCCCYCCYSVVIFKGLQSNLSDMFSIRSSHRRCFIRKVFFKISKKISVKTSARASFLIKLQGLQLYLKRCFPVDFAKFLRIYFLQNTSAQLLLFYVKCRSDPLRFEFTP